MLVWSRSGRAAAWLLIALLFGVIYGLPAAVIALASFAGQWNGVLPSHLTLAHYASALHGDSGAELRVSLLTGAMASAVALVVGTWAALALRHAARRVASRARRRLLHPERGAFRLGRASACWWRSASRRCC